jgi:hypothetical protein
MKKILLLLLCICCACVSQTRKPTDSMTATLCWTGYPDTAASYLLSWRNFDGPDTAWKIIGITKFTEYTMQKGAMKRVIFGARTILRGDTSDIHTSLDSTACLDGACTEACTQGGWYLDWKLKRPSKIKMREPK